MQHIDHIRGTIKLLQSAKAPKWRKSRKNRWPEKITTFSYSNDMDKHNNHMQAPNLIIYFWVLEFRARNLITPHLAGSFLENSSGISLVLLGNCIPEIYGEWQRFYEISPTLRLFCFYTFGFRYPGNEYPILWWMCA